MLTHHRKTEYNISRKQYELKIRNNSFSNFTICFILVAGKRFVFRQRFSPIQLNLVSPFHLLFNYLNSFRSALRLQPSFRELSTFQYPFNLTFFLRLPSFGGVAGQHVFFEANTRKPRSKIPGCIIEGIASYWAVQRLIRHSVWGSRRSEASKRDVVCSFHAPSTLNAHIRRQLLEQSVHVGIS